MRENSEVVIIYPVAQYYDIWGFPKTGVPQKNIYFNRFSIINHPFGDTTIIYIFLCIYIYVSIYIYIYVSIYIYTIQITSPCPTARSCHPASSVVPSAQQTVTKVVVLFRWCPWRRQNGMTWMIWGVYIYIWTCIHEHYTYIPI